MKEISASTKHQGNGDIGASDGVLGVLEERGGGEIMHLILKLS